jgi:hypothetical protein
MAQWKETLEPYVKVQERIKSVTINPTAGEDLIIGCVVISDSGPTTPTLITSQKEFMKTYASGDVSKEYVEGLNQFYTGGDSTLASTIWSNGYRLAGSNTLLVSRASSAQGVNFVKPLVSKTENGVLDASTYVLRDGELLKRVAPFKIVIDQDGILSTDPVREGWAIHVNGVGVFGNLTDDEGPLYDYFVDNLPDLVDKLNETSKFFSPDYTFWSGVATAVDGSTEIPDGQGQSSILIDNNTEDKDSVRTVYFKEVYLAPHFVDKSEFVESGTAYLTVAEPDSTRDNYNQKKLDLNEVSDFEAEPYYAINVFNSASDLKVRIRRFNHDAVVSRDLAKSQKASLSENGPSQYTVLTKVLDTYTKNGSKTPSASVLNRDFFEVAIWDASLNSDEVSFFNVGNIIGRGDITSTELMNMLNMIQLELPEDLHDLGLNYFDYEADDICWKKLDDSKVTPEIIEECEQHEEEEPSTITDLPPVPNSVGIHTRVWRGEEKLTNNIAVDDHGNPIYDGDGNVVYETEKIYEYYVSAYNGKVQSYADVRINPSESAILKVNDAALKRALDLIELDEVYTVEGLCDLGNTEPSFQSYMANMAINSNYFYPISTAKSTNYMTIGNAASKISQDSYKLYLSAPWDIDTGTLGWKFYCSNAVIYWEAVARNRRNNEEFRGILGQVGGIVQYQSPLTEFNKKTRQLLLSKKINTVLWNVATQSWNMNDNYTKQTENTIMNDDGNSRLGIRISKSMPTLLRQFIGRKINDKLCRDVWDSIDRFFKLVILPMEYTVDAYQIFCDYDEDLARQNKIRVVINVRFTRSLKYINVVDNFFDVGMDISSPED